jgi:hypothetical protein
MASRAVLLLLENEYFNFKYLGNTKFCNIPDKQG